jgi:hypothetical protein
MPGASAQPARLQGNILQMSAPVLNALKPTAKPKTVKGEVNAAELDRGWRDAKQDEQKLRASSKQAALQAEEEQRVPLKKLASPVPEAPLAKPPRLVAPEPPERPSRLMPTAPLSKPSATREPEVEAPSRDENPRRAATPPPPLRPLTPAVPRRAITPPPATPTAPELQPPAVERKPVKPREPATTPDPALNPARVRPGTLQPAAPLRKFVKPTPAPPGEPVQPTEKPS